MRYGFFDDAKKEYVIETPATPDFSKHPVERPRRSLVRSTLGFLFEGAVSPNGLTEGVSSVIWYNPMISHRSTFNEPLGCIGFGRLRASPTAVKAPLWVF